MIGAIACTKSEPEGLTNDELIEVLVDIHIAEGLINGHHPLRMKDTLHLIYRKQVFEKHDVRIEDFENGLARVHADPDEMVHVYSSVRTALEDIAKDTNQKFDGKQEKKKDGDRLF